MKKTSKQSALAWYWQRISGILLVVFAVGHYLMVHWTESSGHSFDVSVERLGNPIFVFLYIGFIVLGMYHGVQGVWNIIRDFKLPRPVYLVSVTVLLLAAAYFIYLGCDTILTVDTWKMRP